MVPDRRSGRTPSLFAVLLIAVVAGFAAAGAARAQEVPRFPPKPWGLDTPAHDCVVCHGLRAGDPFRVAPNLQGIVGADIARDADWYAYSRSLRTMEGAWTDENLDKFLEDASAFAPGSKKSIRVRDASKRKKIIEFLKTLQ